MLKNTLEKLNSWYLENFKDTTREDDNLVDVYEAPSPIGIELKMSFLERLKFLVTGKAAYRLNKKEFYFIKNYRL